MKRFSPPAQYSVSGRQLLAQAAPTCQDPDIRRSPQFFGHSRLPGFSLVELLVVVAIIAVLAALTLSTLGYVNKKGAESRARSEVAALSAAIDAYKLERGGYPASNNLYKELTGQGPLNTNRVFFEPIPQMLNTNANPPTLIDPWGANYNYATSSAYFDIWSTAGGATNTNDWIRN